VIGGIELAVGGQKLAWSIADYLESLEKGVDELLKAKDRPEVEHRVKAEAGVKQEAGSQ
jgi:F-type H+-transporting ATPase subunit b